MCGQGFVLFGIKINPSAIKVVFNKIDFKDQLQGALQTLGFPERAVDIISKMPQKLLWPELLSFWRSKAPQLIEDCVDVMSKMDILADPGPLMNKLVDILAHRS